MKPCGLNLVKIEEAQLKISLHSPMGHLNADQKWSTNSGKPMHPYRVIAV